MEKKIYSEGVIARLSKYLKYVVQLKGVGKRTVTSLEISSHTKINSAEIRRDLIFFGLKGKMTSTSLLFPLGHVMTWNCQFCSREIAIDNKIEHPA